MSDFLSGRSRRAPLALALVFLTGCRLAPEDAKPEIVATTPAPADAASPAAPEDNWWKRYGDAGLDEAVTRAMADSPTIAAAYAKVRVARADAGLADAGFLPTFGLGADYRREHHSLSSNIPATAGKTTDDMSLGGGLSYEVDLWGRVRNKDASADALYRSSHADLAAARLVLAGEIAKLWFDLRRLLVLRSLAESRLGERLRFESLVRERTASGIVKADESVRAAGDVSRAREGVGALDQRIARMRHALDAAVGSPVAHPPSATIPAEVPASPVSVSSTLLLARPDIVAADLRLDAALAEEGAARAAFYPNLTLSASGGFASINAGDLFEKTSAIWKLGPTLSLPILSGGKNDAAMERARAAFDTSLAAYRKTVLVAFRETEDALADVALTARRERAARSAFTRASHSRRLAEERRAAGIAPAMETVVARREELDAESALAEVVFDRLRAFADLSVALGGGWDRATALPASLDEVENRFPDSGRPRATVSMPGTLSQP